VIPCCRGGRISLGNRKGPAETPDEFGYASPRLAKAIVTRMWHTQLILTRVGRGYSTTKGHG
jgi:hypothetical protein